ncbi:MAG: hypothetical protein ETSY1_20325 [Candidatus Entotheonella factor]|uniref:Type I restriction enzyme R protein N-terminal domain-containing protein n=1 Tax=Entotheonella factor TaxID=1429438 RepID=W4LIW5_ENTF1|nr:hypothetical protein [Candidatus Entotheonella palauensis]ETW98053.1 MAG: hypothetical protein ETSY1_20325 [Candidatus Entotheonella factor]
MAFSQFGSIAAVQAAYRIRHVLTHDVFGTTAMEPSPQFVADLRWQQMHIDTSSEAARRELLIGPLLREVYRSYADRLALWVEHDLSADAPLSGTPDYMISALSPLGVMVFTTPVLIVIEAKRDDFVFGWGQCLATLVAAQQYNRDTQLEVFGIVTNGRSWEFGRLREEIFTQVDNPVSLADIGVLFAAVDYLFTRADELLSEHTPMPQSGNLSAS